MFGTRSHLILFLLSLPGFASHSTRGIERTLNVRPQFPVVFEENTGQFAVPVKLVARRDQYALELTPAGVRFRFPNRAEPIVVNWANSAATASISGREPAGRTNYLVGNDRRFWRTGIRNYRMAYCNSIYPGVDAVYYGSNGEIEYDLILHPGAPTRQIEMEIIGAEAHINANGDLALTTPDGEIVQRRPVAYQNIGGARIPVATGYVFLKKGRIGLSVAPHHPEATLVIDPVWTYHSYLPGAPAAVPTAIAVDLTGAVYVAGRTGQCCGSTPFPATPNAYQKAGLGYSDGFVYKLSPDGQSLEYATLLGGSSNVDEIYGLAVDAQGQAYVTGTTESSDFPRTPGAFQAAFFGHMFNDTGAAFVTKLTAGGDALVYSTLLGGYHDKGNGIAVDSDGNAYIAGEIASNNFPATPNAIQTSNGARKAFLTKLSTGGSSLVYSTYVGGTAFTYGTAVAIDAARNAYLAGGTYGEGFPTTPGAFQAGLTHTSYNRHGFVSKINSSGSAFVYSTLVAGGSDDTIGGIAVDPVGYAYVAGATDSFYDFPVTPGSYRTSYSSPGQPSPATMTFVAKLNIDGSGLQYCTYLGDDDNHSEITYSIMRIAVDLAGRAYVGGYTHAMTFPVTPDALISSNPDAATSGLGYLGYLSILNPAGSQLQYSTYYYGQVGAVALDAAANVYLASVLLTSAGYYPLSARLEAIVPACLYSLDSAALTMKASESSASINVRAGAGCLWAAYSDASWLTISNGSGAGPGAFAIAVAANAGATQREATIRVAGQTITVSQRVAGPAQLAVTANRVVELRPGLNAKYVIQVSNGPEPAGPTDGPVAVTITIPAGLSVLGISGPGWACAVDALTCSRSDALLPGATYPAVTLVVNVTGTAGATIVTRVSASGGGSTPVGTSDTAMVAASSVPLRFVPITPCRVADTRRTAGPFGGPALSGGGVRDFAIAGTACGVPASAQAYSLNVAVVPTGSLGYLTVWPSGQARPVVSTLNSMDGRIKSNAAIVPAGAGGVISVFASDPTHVVLDLSGYFVPATDPAALAYYSIPPCRVADTRNTAGPLGGPALAAGQSRSFAIQTAAACNIPATAQAYSLNLAAVPRGPLGYLTAWPTGHTQPVVASLNAPTGTITANAAIVPAGTNGSIDVFVSDTTDLVIDINGYFAPSSAGGLSLYNVTPCRAIDTRQQMQAAFSGRLDVNVAASGCGPTSTAGALVVAAVVVPAGPLGYLTLWGFNQNRPLVSTLNALDGSVTSNMAIVPAVTGTFSAFPSYPTHLIIDIYAYYGQ
jgi:hypothetical protein